MAFEEVLSDQDSENEVDDEVADIEDRRVCTLIYAILCFDFIKLLFFFLLLLLLLLSLSLFKKIVSLVEQQ